MGEAVRKLRRYRFIVSECLLPILLLHNAQVRLPSSFQLMGGGGSCGYLNVDVRNLFFGVPTQNNIHQLWGFGSWDGFPKLCVKCMAKLEITDKHVVGQGKIIFESLERFDRPISYYLRQVYDTFFNPQ